MPDRKASGRTTPKGTTPGNRPTPSGSSRYTPPAEHHRHDRSPAWVAVAMFTCFALSAAIIILNYFDVLPGGADTKYLAIGLGFVTVGFVLATRLR